MTEKMVSNFSQHRLSKVDQIEMKLKLNVETFCAETNFKKYGEKT